MIKLSEEKLTKEKRLPTIERLSPEMRAKVERIGQMEYECYLKYQEYINNKNINNNSNNNNKICEETEQYKPKIKHPHDKAMKDILSNKVEEIAKEQLEPETKSAIIQYINCFIEGKYGQEVARNMIEKLNLNDKEEKSMLSDVLDQIEERGRKLGLTEGLQESKRKMIKVAKNLLKKGLSKAEVAEITELNIKEINEIAN